VSDPDAAPAASSLPSLRGARTFRRHLLIYLLVNTALTGANIYTGAPWWAFWPLVVWGLLLMLHFLFHRATSVEDAWVEERTLDVRTKSYDMSHIDDIRKQPAPSLGNVKADPPPPPGR
jgi:hypothetical protein